MRTENEVSIWIEGYLAAIKREPVGHEMKLSQQV
jgi:hypothetical protein